MGLLRIVDVWGSGASGEAMGMRLDANAARSPQRTIGFSYEESCRQ